MKNIYQKITILISTIIIAACVTSGKNFTMETVNSFTPGETTVTIAKEKLGKPIATKYGENGETIYAWRYFTSSVFGSKGQIVTISFSKDEKMLKVLKKVEID